MWYSEKSQAARADDSERDASHLGAPGLQGTHPSETRLVNPTASGNTRGLVWFRTFSNWLVKSPQQRELAELS